MHCHAHDFSVNELLPKLIVLIIKLRTSERRQYLDRLNPLICRFFDEDIIQFINNI